ncbi:hypothetical protein QJS10_CPB15g01183 [Acorus calamus]|uniref:Disease resistance N-terminal domain-containing protein n=1 Tax=Acorus calamus TaxID=4465 RepID=A0AAV9D5Z4_ACOCL|nr:hypothetical protein QJS10_CPB15g01183 [Acorus calamus]
METMIVARVSSEVEQMLSLNRLLRKPGTISGQGCMNAGREKGRRQAEDMADAVVSFLVVKVSKQLIEEADFLYGVSDQVKNLKSEFKLLQQFLNKANMNHKKNEGMNEWLQQLRDAAYVGEDIIDEYILQMSAASKGGQT